MTDPGMNYPSGTDGERRPGRTPDAGDCVLCIYCRTDRFVYWPSAMRLSLAGCPGCQRREPAGRDIAPLAGWPTAEFSVTAPSARDPAEPLTVRSRVPFSLLAGPADDR
jgi:hypothetical protein